MTSRRRAAKPLPDNDDSNYVRQRPGVVTDSYSNPAARIGNGTPNLAQAGSYPIVRLTEDYPLILSLYRSSWVVRKIIDNVSNDLYRTFPTLITELKPEHQKHFISCVRKTNTIAKLRSASKWGRLFGGAAAIIVIEGHDDLMQPLELDDIEVGSYKGIIPLDRWSGIIPGPVINSDISDPKGFGLPTYYNCIMDSGAVNIHHSRVLRFTGRELPQWETQVELYWGMSEVEVIFDELQKRDYSSWNIVSLLTRAQIITIEEPQLAALMSGANATNSSYEKFVNRMESISQLLNNQGLLVLGKDGKLNQSSYSFGGISDVYHEFMKDLAAAAEQPYELIFGREAGMGGGGNFSSNGAMSLQLYYNTIDQKREADANPVIDKLLPIICMSTFGHVPDDLEYSWPPLMALSRQEQNELGKGLVESILMAYNADLITKREARSELSQQSGVNGLFSNITRQSIAETPDTFASESGMGEINNPEGGDGGGPQRQPQGQPQGQPVGGPQEQPVGGPQEQAHKSAVGIKPGENIPTEAKAIGVKALRYRPAHRIIEAAKTNSKSLQQGLQHSVKHDMKNPRRTPDGIKNIQTDALPKSIVDYIRGWF